MDLFTILIFIVVVFECGCFRTAPGCSLIRLRNGQVKYRQRGKIARFLCNRGYTLAGERYSLCSGKKWDNTATKCVRGTCKIARPPLHGIIYPSHNGGVLNFMCTNGFELTGISTVFCDGISWDNPIPACLATNTSVPLSCDFEKPDLCGWNHDLNHDFDWQRLNYNTPSYAIGTGPSYDHTKGAGKDGYYMYIESSARNINDTARFISPVYKNNDETLCFEFYYHMYGATTGSLRVYLKNVNESWNLSLDKALFVRNGNQGNKWYRGFVVLHNVSAEFQIVIEGVRGLSYVSDIAIDDVRLIVNCVPDQELTDELTTTEEYFSSTPLLSVESCENRCNQNDTKSSSSVIGCACDEECYDRNQCCPDYYDVCVGGTTTEDYIITTSTPEIIKTSETSTATTRTTLVTKRLTSTSSMLPMFPTTPSISTIKSTTKIVIPKTDRSKETVTESDFEEIPLHPIIEKETHPPAIQQPSKEIEIITERDNDKMFDRHKIEVPLSIQDPNTRTIIFAIGVIFGILFALSGMVFVARRYQLCRCVKLRFYQSSNGDSLSDVRFLTSDELLNLNLDSDYDTL